MGVVASKCDPLLKLETMAIQQHKVETAELIERMKKTQLTMERGEAMRHLSIAVTNAENSFLRLGAAIDEIEKEQ